MKPFFSTIFPATDKSDWLIQAQKESKSVQNGEDAYESLLWQTENGFVLEPYYTANDFTNSPILTSSTGVETIQTAQKHSLGWLNAPEYTITDEKSDNSILRDALARGADALVLNLPDQLDQPDNLLSRLLNGIKLSDTPVFFHLNPLKATTFLQTLKTVAPYQLKGGLLMDAGSSTAEVTRLTANSPQFRTVCASSHVFHNAGATATQELAFTLASLTDTYDHLTRDGLTIEQLVPKTVVSMSVGTSYFPEIAKLRAIRVLLARFLSAYSPSPFPSLLLHCQTSAFYDAKTTVNTNLLRATTEAMAAVIGGCDVLTVHPYDMVVRTSAELSDHEFSDRIARNVSVLLKEESYLNKVADPSAGSYYIETVTHKLVEAAWLLFLDIEKQGGLSMSLASGFIQNELERSLQAKVETVRNGKVLVGVTKFKVDEPSAGENIPANDFTGSLPARRLSEQFE